MKQVQYSIAAALLLVTVGTAMADTTATNASSTLGSASHAPQTTAVKRCSQSDPVNMLVCVSSHLLKTLKRDKVMIKQNPSHIYTLVDNELLPYVDQAKMAQSVLGRNAWNRATPQQQQRFSKAFIALVVRTYAGALDAYTDEGIRFFPIRGGVGNRQFVNVSSQIMRSEGQPVAVSYSLAKTAGRWQVYDMVVEGVSLLQSFRSQIEGMLSQGASLDQIITRLEQHPVSSKKTDSY